MALLASRAKKAELVVLSELLRKKMLQENTPLIRNRWNFFKGHPDVFVAAEATAWACRNLPITFPRDYKLDGALQQLSLEEDETNEDVCSSLGSVSFSNDQLTHEQAVAMFQKLLDAGILKSATEKRKEEFVADKSFFRFAVDDSRCDNFIRSIVLGFRIYSCAVDPESRLFQRVCSLGQFVSDESLQACEIVTWICKHFNIQREAATNLADHMLQNSIIGPVHYRVTEFMDNSYFYLFKMEFKMVSISHLLEDASYTDVPTPQRKCPSPPPTYESLLKSDGSVTKAALLHPEAPFVKRDLKVVPDGCGYGFCVRGDGPCFIKVVDPDSPAGKAGVKEKQFVTNINGKSVLDMKYRGVEDLIVEGPGRLEITVLEQKPYKALATSTSTSSTSSEKFPSPLPSPQSWMFSKPQRSYTYPQSLMPTAQVQTP